MQIDMAIEFDKEIPKSMQNAIELVDNWAKQKGNTKSGTQIAKKESPTPAAGESSQHKDADKKT